MDDDAADGDMTEMSDLERLRAGSRTHKTRSKTPKAPAAPKRPWRAASIRPKSPGPDFERFGPYNQLSHDHLHKIAAPR